jgi:hypothetical protein
VSEGRRRDAIAQFVQEISYALCLDASGAKQPNRFVNASAHQLHRLGFEDPRTFRRDRGARIRHRRHVDGLRQRPLLRQLLAAMSLLVDTLPIAVPPPELRARLHAELTGSARFAPFAQERRARSPTCSTAD